MNIIKERRTKRGYTQSHLARLIGASDGTEVSRWESCRVTPSPKFAYLLSEVLGGEPNDYRKGKGK